MALVHAAAHEKAAESHTILETKQRVLGRPAFRLVRSTGCPRTEMLEGSSMSCSSSGVATVPLSNRTCTDTAYFKAVPKMSHFLSIRYQCGPLQNHATHNGAN